jgi:osmotically-inducible protein OsmY
MGGRFRLERIASGCSVFLPPSLWGRVGVGGESVLPLTPALPHKEGGRKTYSRSIYLQCALGLILSLALTSCGCSQDADLLARVFHKTAAKFDGVTGRLRDKLHNGWGVVRGSLSEASLDSRVALRLRWDSDMTGADVQVRLAGPGVVELNGTVADLTQRRRAVELANTTVGVENVLDRLRVEADADKP